MPNSSRHSPLVSVIVPSHNYARFVDELLRNVQAQTLQDWECIFIDDGSTDDTRATVEPFAAADPRIRYFHTPNRGLRGARNLGLSHSRGRYFQFLDADDLLEPEKLERQARYLDEHPEVGVVYGEARYFQDGDLEHLSLSQDGGNHPWTSTISAQGPELLKALVTAGITTVNAPLLRASVARMVGEFDEDREYAEDWDYWLRCALAGATFHFRHWPATRALVRSHGSSISQNRMHMLAGQVALRQALNARLQDPELIALNKRLEADTRILLRLEAALSERSFIRRSRRLLRAATAGRKLRWFAYALALPVGRNPRFKPFAQKLHAALRNPRSH